MTNNQCTPGKKLWSRSSGASFACEFEVLFSVMLSLLRAENKFIFMLVINLALKKRKLADSNRGRVTEIFTSASTYYSVTSTAN